MEYGGDLLDLTYANTHRFPPPPWVLPDFVAAASGGGMTYTPYRGDERVRSAVAESLSAFLGIDIDPHSELILTPGSQAALFVAMSATVADTVALVDPDYMSDEKLLRFLGAQIQHVPLLWGDFNQPPSIDLDVLERAFKAGASTLVFSNPNNPTGMVLPPTSSARSQRSSEPLTSRSLLTSCIPGSSTTRSPLLISLPKRAWPNDASPCLGPPRPNP